MITSLPTMLYVEDEETDVLLLRVALSKHNLEGSLRSVDNGRSAIRYLAGIEPYQDRQLHPMPAVVLLDLNLPELSGFEVLHWIRSQAALQGLPVVVFSSSNREEDMTRARHLGANDYWQKPNSHQTLARLAERIKTQWLTGSAEMGSDSASAVAARSTVVQ